MCIHCDSSMHGFLGRCFSIFSTTYSVQRNYCDHKSFLIPSGAMVLGTPNKKLVLIISDVYPSLPVHLSSVQRRIVLYPDGAMEACAEGWPWRFGEASCLWEGREWLGLRWHNTTNLQGCGEVWHHKRLSHQWSVLCSGEGKPDCIRPSWLYLSNCWLLAGVERGDFPSPWDCIQMLGLLAMLRSRVMWMLCHVLECDKE